MSAFSWALLAALCWGFAPVFEKLGLRGAAPLPALFYRCLGVFIGFAILMVFMVKPAELRTIDARSALFLVAGGFVASFLGQVCFYNSLKLGAVSRMVPVSGSYPLIAFVLGVLLLGEGINLYKLAGAGLILAGLWFLKLG